MNIILFTEDELNTPLSRRDRRAQHILKVLRLNTGDHFQLGLIDGPRGTAQITDITANEIAFATQLDKKVPNLYPIKMIIGLTRPRYARRILKDLTSQGASELHFVATDTGEKSYLHSTLWSDENYQQHLIEGAEQAFCTRLPSVVVHTSLQACLNTLAIDANRIALDNYEATHPIQDCTFLHKTTIVAIGSERGWSDAERDQFRTHQYTLASMGKRVLKTETASTAALAIILSNLSL